MGGLFLLDNLFSFFFKNIYLKNCAVLSIRLKEMMRVYDIYWRFLCSLIQKSLFSSCQSYFYSSLNKSSYVSRWDDNTDYTNVTLV